MIRFHVRTALYGGARGEATQGSRGVFGAAAPPMLGHPKKNLSAITLYLVHNPAFITRTQ